ncbi:unnamed protein product, partial [Amoebophrya sp. A25]|eukprot:GSA25T00016334001.1
MSSARSSRSPGKKKAFHDDRGSLDISGAGSKHRAGAKQNNHKFGGPSSNRLKEYGAGAAVALHQALQRELNLVAATTTAGGEERASSGVDADEGKNDDQAGGDADAPAFSKDSSACTSNRRTTRRGRKQSSTTKFEKMRKTCIPPESQLISPEDQLPPGSFLSSLLAGQVGESEGSEDGVSPPDKRRRQRPPQRVRKASGGPVAKESQSARPLSLSALFPDENDRDMAVEDTGKGDLTTATRRASSKSAKGIKGDTWRASSASSKSEAAEGETTSKSKGINGDTWRASSAEGAKGKGDTTGKSSKS